MLCDSTECALNWQEKESLLGIFVMLLGSSPFQRYPKVLLQNLHSSSAWHRLIRTSHCGNLHDFLKVHSTADLFFLVCVPHVFHHHSEYFFLYTWLAVFRVSCQKSLTVEHTWKINEKHYSFNHFSSRSSNPEDACLWINLIYSTMFLWEYQLKTGNFS